jgi:membrane-associated protease RseP (regulator of RpoE activity)
MTAHAFSLASKLATLDVGDVILLPDDAAAMSATQMERQVTNAIAKSAKLAGRKFRTSRCDTVTVGRTLMHALLIERIK